MKYLIACLGNFGSEYHWTRHNIGFLVADYLGQKYDMSFSEERYGSVARVKTKGRTFILLKPNTFMNLSGKAVTYWLEKENIDLTNLCVVVDDLNFDYGRISLRKKGSAGGHNGLKDIEERLGTSEYPRLRIGIGNDFRKGAQTDYVLGTWNEVEREALPRILQKAGETVVAFGTLGIDLAMNLANK